VSQSKPSFGLLPKESHTRMITQNRSRRESNPHLRFRKPPFYPLNYGNNDIFDFRFSISDCKLPCDSAHQRNEPAAAGDFELAKDGVEVLFHHRPTQAGVLGDFLIRPPLADKSRNFLFASG
jgi:hypothetical protein